jgi:hypothetical protein
MPRKKTAEAQAEDQASRRARVRYGIRNPEFWEEFNELRRRVPGLPDASVDT